MERTACNSLGDMSLERDDSRSPLILTTLEEIDISLIHVSLQCTQ